MNSIKVIKVEVEPELETSTHKCLIDCIELAMAEQVDVLIRMNNRTYLADFDALIELVDKTADEHI